MDDVYNGAGPVLARAAREGHRVVVVTVVSDFSTWALTSGREDRTRRDLDALAEFTLRWFHEMWPNLR
jgi:LmbE family N-acetylglucosaminyl deacetylase